MFQEKRKQDKLELQSLNKKDEREINGTSVSAGEVYKN